jgi:microcystin degradation protein MlrC
MKVYLGGLSAATNCFVNTPTTYSDFEVTSLVYGSNAGSDPFSPQGLLAVFWSQLKSRGWELVDGQYAFASTGGRVTRHSYERLRDEILAELEEALPVDIVALALHGGMVAEFYEDCEVDLLARIRQKVGERVPIGVLIDPHSNLSDSLMQYTDLLVAYKEYPHTDMVERATELLDLLEKTKAGQVNPVMSSFDCRMVGIFITGEQPLRGFMDKMKELEKEEHILSISIFSGNVFDDSPDLSAKILVITDDKKELGDQLARQLGQELFGMRREIVIGYVPVDEALKQAASSNNPPVILADTGDSIVAGAMGDATFLLQAMIDKGIRNAVIHNIWDPIAVQIAFKAGKGAEIDLRIGGKGGPASGTPLDLHVRVARTYPELSFMIGNYRYHFGDTVVLEVGGIELVLASKREGVYHHKCFTAVGINPLQRQILAVKLIAEFVPGFESVATEMLQVATPGASTWDLTSLPYKNVRRNLYPFVDDPFAE